jgi:hypothetical protein
MVKMRPWIGLRVSPFQRRYVVEMFRSFNFFDGDLLQLVERRKSCIASSRMSVRSVMESISGDNPDITKLLWLVEGMPLCARSDLVPNGAVVSSSGAFV